MHPTLCVVTRIPLTELWNDVGTVPAIRSTELDRDAIRALIGNSPVVLVIADIGNPLRWVPLTATFDVWKNELRAHVVPPERPLFLETTPHGFAYVASRWITPADGQILLFERRHSRKLRAPRLQVEPETPRRSVLHPAAIDRLIDRHIGPNRVLRSSHHRTRRCVSRRPQRIVDSGHSSRRPPDHAFGPAESNRIQPTKISPVGFDNCDACVRPENDFRRTCGLLTHTSRLSRPAHQNVVCHIGLRHDLNE